MAVAVVNYNTREHLKACLASVAAQAPGEVIVLDNASTDGSPEMVGAVFPQFRLIAGKDNPGYGAAANRCIANSTSDYILLLNSDTLLAPGTLESLRDYLERNPQVAIAGPRIVNPDGSLQVSCFPFPSPLYAFLRVNSLGTLIGRIPFLRDRYLPAWPHDQARVVPWVLGAALAIRRKAFEEVGGFDESFFMYSEEVDLCFRLKKAGWQVHFAPVTRVVHLGGASTVQQRAAMEVQRYSSTNQFYRRHYSDWQRLLLRLIVTYSICRNLLHDRFRLIRAKQPEERARIAEDLTVWKRVLERQWQE